MLREGLLPTAVAALLKLGISRESLACRGLRLRGIAFRGDRNAPAADFQASGAAFGLRRTALQTPLSARARELGVSFLSEHARLQQTSSGTAVKVAGATLTPRWIVGADGAQSTTRAFASLDAGSTLSRRYALRQHFLLKDEQATPDRVTVHWAANAQAYVTPIAPGFVGIAVLAPQKLGSMEQALRRFPSLAPLLHGAAPSTAQRGAVSLHRTLRRVQRGIVALVGDASGSVDAITGDGLAIAFEQALALAEALRARDLERYQAAHDRILLRPRMVSRALLALSDSPLLLRGSLLALERVPALFPALLRFHTGVPGKKKREDLSLPAGFLEGEAYQPMPKAMCSGSPVVMVELCPETSS